MICRDDRGSGRETVEEALRASYSTKPRTSYLSRNEILKADKLSDEFLTRVELKHSLRASRSAYGRRRRPSSARAARRGGAGWGGPREERENRVAGHTAVTYAQQETGSARSVTCLSQNTDVTACAVCFCPWILLRLRVSVDDDDYLFSDGSRARLHLTNTVKNALLLSDLSPTRNGKGECRDPPQGRPARRGAAPSRTGRGRGRLRRGGCRDTRIRLSLSVRGTLEENANEYRTTATKKITSFPSPSRARAAGRRGRACNDGGPQNSGATDNAIGDVVDVRFCGRSAPERPRRPAVPDLPKERSAKTPRAWQFRRQVSRSPKRMKTNVSIGTGANAEIRTEP
ncbi:hypothetical protein EVAR_25235_1 [Eumeta japonica]|uniref:Uncharacterized protein n=1 Tax=Eumeta variegata TaxID=151549 RepID=A0A4C1WGM9_EUMVA|nr:hypothetical protein EVAR_25235_1 [Eumeta japonica]